MNVESFDIWESPAHEASLYSNIPIDFLDDFRQYSKNRQVKLRVVYRGPRNVDRNSTRKHEATAFSVYLVD
jgi:hypothetical protein